MSVDIVKKGKTYERQKRTSIDIKRLAHPVDGKVISVLEKTGIKHPLEAMVEQLVSLNYGTLLAAGVTVDDKNFPVIYENLSQCAHKLGISIPYTVITNEMDGINAGAMGTDENAFIMISNQAPRLLNEQELKFIIAHECGHIAMRHMVYHTVGNLAAVVGGYVPLIGKPLSEAAVFPLNYWNRCSEITADRVGLICCGDLETAQRALLKIIGGFTDVKDIDVHNYIKKSKTIQNKQTLGRVQEYFQTHPLIYKRLQALELFADSQLYASMKASFHSYPYGRCKTCHAEESMTGMEEPKASALLSEAELNARVDELLRVY